MHVQAQLKTLRAPHTHTRTPNIYTNSPYTHKLTYVNTNRLEEHHIYTQIPAQGKVHRAPHIDATHTQK